MLKPHVILSLQNIDQLTLYGMQPRVYTLFKCLFSDGFPYERIMAIHLLENGIGSVYEPEVIWTTTGPNADALSTAKESNRLAVMLDKVSPYKVYQAQVFLINSTNYNDEDWDVITSNKVQGDLCLC